MPLRRLAIGLTVVVVVTFLVASMAIQKRFEIEYHQRQMDIAYESVFANPESLASGLTKFSPTTDDFEGTLEAYRYHRQTLVDLGTLVRLQASLPHLSVDHSVAKSELRTAFVYRMWNTFPNHRHYYLDSEGQFETWVSSESIDKWNQFIDQERSAQQPIE